MQKLLLLIACLIFFLGFYTAYWRIHPERCSDRAIQQYVSHKIGILEMSDQPDAGFVRSLQISYIRQNGCVERFDKATGKFDLPGSIQYVP